MSDDGRRVGLTFLLVCVALLLGVAGREVLDWLASAMPAYSREVEWVGGWAVGMVVGVLVLIPLFRLWGCLQVRPQALTATRSRRQPIPHIRLLEPPLLYQ